MSCILPPVSPSEWAMSKPVVIVHHPLTYYSTAVLYM